MAFDASKPDDAGPIGTFGVPSNGQTLNCTDGTNVIFRNSIYVWHLFLSLTTVNL